MNTNGASASLTGHSLVLGLFGIAMGALEAIVVVYLRQIYYPRLFEFPLNLLPPQMLTLEWLREASTLVMLAAVGILAGRNHLQRFAYFLYTFAVWDIFYYVWLKILLDWPPSLLTWDVLFLIPVPWIGPVLAPVIASCTMILLGATILYLQGKGYAVKLKAREWSLIFSGVLLILGSFVGDYSKILIREWSLMKAKAPGVAGQILEGIAAYRPTSYHWELFLLGELLIGCAVVLMYRRTREGMEG